MRRYRRQVVLPGLGRRGQEGPSAALADDAEGLGDDVLLVDVRKREEFSAVHIPGAVNIPLSDVEKYSETSAQKIGTLLNEGPERSRIVVCCASGCGRPAPSRCCGARG